MTRIPVRTLQESSISIRPVAFITVQPVLSCKRAYEKGRLPSASPPVLWVPSAVPFCMCFYIMAWRTIRGHGFGC